MFRVTVTKGKAVEIDKLTFYFIFCALHVYGDGSAWASPLPVEFRDKGYYGLTILPDKPYLGAAFQPIYSDLGYGMQDKVIQHFANAEHAALHLWVSAARDESLLRADDEAGLNLAASLKAMFGKDMTRDHHEVFITNVQLLANGIQPRAIPMSEVITAANLLGLNPTMAIPAALAFLSYFRAQTRKEFAARVA